MNLEHFDPNDLNATLTPRYVITMCLSLLCFDIDSRYSSSPYILICHLTTYHNLVFMDIFIHDDDDIYIYIYIYTGLKKLSTL